MEIIYETSKTRELDKYTIDIKRITSLDLIDSAASVFVNEFNRKFASQDNKVANKVYVFAGPGNNGADALSIAHLLNENGTQVFTFLINPSDSLSPECDIVKKRLIDYGLPNFTEVSKQLKLPKLEKQDIIIDGLFGSGLNRTLDGGYAKIIHYINQSKSTIVSVDIPSGLFGEDNSHNDLQNIIQADYTFTFEYPKLSFLFPENACFTGEWKAIPIGLVADETLKAATPYSIINEEDFFTYFKPRDRFTHKGHFGHALLMAGSVGKIGAAVLAARSCMRSGAGMLTVHLPHRGEIIMQTSLPEAMVSLDNNHDHISNLPDLSRYSAVGIGPGIGTDNQTKSVLKQLIENNDGKPLVIDADALNIIAEDGGLLNSLPAGTIITPHPKEFARLAGESENSYERLQKARSIATEQKIYIILKDAYSAVCTPEGKVYFNTIGNSGMATAGSGDVLTGLILGLLAQGYEPEKAAILGVYTHSNAGNLAANALSEESMLAGDITSMLGKVFKIMQESDYTALIQHRH